MSTEDNEALARRAFDALNQRNWAGFYELVAPDIVLHNASMTIQGREAYKQFVSMYIVTAFPDLHFTIEDLIAAGDTVVVRQTYRGTHKGDLMGIPPTGKQVTITSIDIGRFAGGKLVEHWGATDSLGLQQQLGVVPPMGQAS